MLYSFVVVPLMSTSTKISEALRPLTNFNITVFLQMSTGFCKSQAAPKLIPGETLVALGHTMAFAIHETQVVLGMGVSHLKAALPFRALKSIKRRNLLQCQNSESRPFGRVRLMYC